MGNGDGMLSEGSQQLILLVRARGLVCALPLPGVVETMRPLPVESLAGRPPFVRGVSVIRGRPAPVIDLEDLIGGDGSAAPAARFVTIRTGDRLAALAVSGVLGLRRLDPAAMEQLPPLLRGAGESAIRAMSALDSELLAVLDAGRLVPDDVWRDLERTP